MNKTMEQLVYEHAKSIKGEPISTIEMKELLSLDVLDYRNNSAANLYGTSLKIINFLLDEINKTQREE